MHSTNPVHRIKLGQAVALVVGMAILCGCSQSTGQWTRADFTIGYELPLGSSDSLTPPIQASDLKAVSANIVLIADNQRHELLGDRADWYENAFSDDYASPAAIRPPQLNLFGQDLLTESLAIIDDFVLHLGDACDISNTAEFGRFAWDMQSAPKGWIMAPGNHDGYFFGNSSREWDYYKRDWDTTAESFNYGDTRIESRSMQKDRFISYYLAALIMQDAALSRPLAESLGQEVLERFEYWVSRDRDASTFADFWPVLVDLQNLIYEQTDSDAGYQVFELPASSAPQGEPHLSRLAWHIDKDRMWRSFVVQQLDLGSPNPSPSVEQGRFNLLVLDTAQYKLKPAAEIAIPTGLLHGITGGYVDFQIAGLVGGLYDTQLAAVDGFTASMREARQRWMLAIHHPYEMLGRTATKHFNRLRDESGMPAILSAHMHTGSVRWNQDSSRDGDWLEINVGSLLDAPQEFRDFQIYSVGDQLMINSRRQLLVDALRQRGLVADALPGYKPGPDDPDWFLAYKDGALDLASDVDFKVKRVLLATYLRMFTLFDSDHADQTTTYWPVGPDNNTLTEHDAVVESIDAMLKGLSKADTKALTRFLFELREYDRTRRLTESTGARVRAYRLSQSIWASDAEFQKPATRDDMLDADLSYFLLPSLTTIQPVTD